MKPFAERLEQLDEGLLGHIISQTTREDRRSLLALHWAARRQWGQFVYLEIGSYLGGSLQALAADAQCRKIVSLDPRPARFADERGADCVYVDNSAARMLKLLAEVPGADVTKIQTIDAGTDAINPKAIEDTPDFCFVDGEHTDAAVVRDAQFCLERMNPDGCLAFHDSNIVYNGLRRVVGLLAERGRSFRAYNLPHSLFVIELGNCRFGEAEPIAGLLRDNHIGYLWGLETTDLYRRYYLRREVQWLRKFDDKMFGLRKHWARLRGRPVEEVQPWTGA